MVESSDTSSWDTAPLQQLEAKVGEAKQANKYLFIWDKQGNVGTFMQYKGQLCDIAPQVCNMQLGRCTAADIGETIRHNFVSAMRNGDNLCIDMGATTPDFTEFNSENTFDANLFFNWADFNVEATYKQYVRENENHGIGGLNPGHYMRSPNFGMSIRSGADSEEAVLAQLAKIPNSDQFAKIIFQ